MLSRISLPVDVDVLRGKVVQKVDARRRYLRGKAAFRSLTDRTVLSAVTQICTISLKSTWHQFSREAAAPQNTQECCINNLLNANRETTFGKQHNFETIHSVRDFQKKIPIRGYDEYVGWIERVARGDKSVLTRQPVKMMEISSGTSSSNKLIPYTDDLLSEFSKATNPWLYNLYSGMRELGGTTSYWSISPAMKQNKMTAGGIPIGFEDDTEYFSPVKRWMLRKSMAVPASVSKIGDLATWRQETLRHLLAADNLGLISVWSPSFLTLLMESLADNLDGILSLLPVERSQQIERAIKNNNNNLSGEVFWPRLKVISCWTDGWARHFLPDLKRWFPKTFVQPKGLLATEGVVSFPILDQPGSVLAVGGHFLEFIDLAHPTGNPLLSHELKIGGQYSPVLTTGGGLYRYHLKDIVECVGMYKSTPLIRFVGKKDSVSDICGEKLNSDLVGRAVEHACCDAGFSYRFALLSPHSEPKPHYCLYVDGEGSEIQLEQTMACLEKTLSESHHYSYCRRLGQLGSLRVVRVTRGIEKYMEQAASLGKRAGNIKPISLDVQGIAPLAFKSELMNAQKARL